MILDRDTSDGRAILANASIFPVLMKQTTIDQEGFIDV